MSRFTFLRLVNRVCDERAIPPTRFGRDALGDPRFIFDLRAGRTPGRKVQIKVIDYILASGEA